MNNKTQIRRIKLRDENIITVSDGWEITDMNMSMLRGNQNEINFTITKCTDNDNSSNEINIVRCKDCKYWDSDYGDPMECSITNRITLDTDYCSYGKPVNDRSEPVIVLCKDCRYWYQVECDPPKGWCSKGVAELTEPEWYCAEAERINRENNGD